MSKNIIQLISLLLLSVICYEKAQAQTPDYLINDNIGSDPIPLANHSSNSAQFLLTPADFGTLIPPGNITAIYVYVAPTLNPPNVTFTDFKVRMGMTQDTTTPGSGQTINTSYYGSLKVVVPAQTKTFGTGGSGTLIQLDSTFYYDGTSSLIVEISQEGYSSGSSGLNLKVNSDISFGNRRIYGATGSSAGTSNTGRLNFGMNITPVPVPDLALDTLITDVSLDCEGEKIMSAVISNIGSVDIDSFKINWELNWTAQPTIQYSQTLPIGASDTVTLGTVLFLPNTPRNFKVWTSEPNGVQDNDNSNDTFSNNLVALNALPSATTIEITPAGNDSFTFSLLNEENVDEYLWDFGDGSTSTLSEPGHTYTPSGSYSISVIISNDCGSDTLTSSIDAVNINIITEKASLNLYPNPAKDKIIIVSKDFAIEKISIFNILGQLVYKKKLTDLSPSYEVQLSGFSSGVYTIHLTTEKGQVIRKFQKR